MGFGGIVKWEISTNEATLTNLSSDFSIILLPNAKVVPKMSDKPISSREPLT